MKLICLVYVDKFYLLLTKMLKLNYRIAQYTR